MMKRVETMPAVGQPPQSSKNQTQAIERKRTQHQLMFLIDGSGAMSGTHHTFCTRYVTAIIQHFKALSDMDTSCAMVVYRDYCAQQPVEMMPFTTSQHRALSWYKGIDFYGGFQCLAFSDGLALALQTLDSNSTDTNTTQYCFVLANNAFPVAPVNFVARYKDKTYIDLANDSSMLGVQLSVISPRDLEPLRMLYRTALNENAAIENLEVMTKDGQLVMFCLPSRVLEFLAEQLAPLPHVHTTKPPVNNKPGTSTSAHPAGANNATTNTNPKSNGFTPAGRGANYNADATAIPNANAMNNGKGPVNLLSPGPGMPFQPTPSPTQANNASSLHWNGTLRWNQIEYPHMCALSARFVNGAKNTQAFPLDRLPQNLEITTVHARDQLGIEPQAELKANGFIVMHGLSTIPPEEKRVNDLRLETIKSRLSVNDCYGYVQLPANPENKDLLILALLAGGRLNLFGLVIPSLNSGQSIFRTANMVTPQQIGTQGTMGMSPTLGLARGQQTPTPAQTQAHTQAQVQAQAQMLHNRQMGSPMTSNQATQQQHQQQQQQMMYGRHMQ